MGIYKPPQINPGYDTVWVGLNSFIIFFMQLGFTMVEAGTVRVKNIHSIIMKNTLDVCVVTITWWMIGYSFAFGESLGGIIGTTKDLILGIDLDTHNSYLHLFYQWTFASASCTIVSGSVAERLTIKGYMILTVSMSCLIYPVIVHWIWAEGGWLKENSFHDLAGVCVVHMVGGSVGLVATIIIKPRIGRFDLLEINKFKPNSVPFVVLGTLLLWFCWYGFNCGSVTDLQTNYIIVGKVGVNTSVAAVGGCLTCFILTHIIEPRIQYDLLTLNLCMGILSGLVSITGCCDVVQIWAALIIGIIGGCVFIGFQKLLYKLKIDDPLDASTIHLGCGIWGGLASGIFKQDDGLIYGGGQIGIQIAGMLCLLLWTSITTFLTMKFIQSRGLLRCSAHVEQIGYDNVYNQEMGDAYNLQQILQGVDALKKSLKGIKQN